MAQISFNLTPFGYGPYPNSWWMPFLALVRIMVMPGHVSAQNMWVKVNAILGDVATEQETHLSTATPLLIEKYWEQDVIDQMVMKDRLCVVLWIQQDGEGELAADEAAETFINRFDTENVAVFRISSLSLLERLKSFEQRLSGAKFDGRIRLVVNVKEPVPSVKQILSLAYLRTVPILVNTSGIDSPEDSIYELGRLKPDTQFSTKPADFDKYCSFATVLWINFKEDPSRVIVEKRVSKTGVVIQKTDSVERGLKYMDAHGHLAYVPEFRIIIGDGKLTLDETSEAALNANKKRDFFAARAAQMRRGPAGSSKGKSEEEFSTLELVQVIRNRQKWHTPILVFSYDPAVSADPGLYAFKNLKAAHDLDTLEYFSSMKALPWAVELADMLTDTNANAPGFLRIVNLRCNNLLPKKAGSTLDPFVIVKVADAFEKKTKKLSSTLNPTWNLGWEIPCKLSDRISLQVSDKGMFGKSDFEASFDGILSDLIPVATPLVEVTKMLEAHQSTPPTPKSPSPSSNLSTGGAATSTAKPSHDLARMNLPGTVTIEIGFRLDGQREVSLGKVFGQPFEQTIDDTIRDAVPHLTESAICQLTLRGLEIEGIFRQPANQKRVDAMKDLFDKGTNVDLATEDPQDIAFLLRTYIKELPQPLIPRSKYQAFKACTTVDKRREKLVALSDVLGQLPPHNLEVFANVMHLLSDIAKNELLNKMTARNLATVLGPALVIPRDVEADPSTYLTDTTAVSSVLETCILFYHKLFQRGAQAAVAPPPASSSSAANTPEEESALNIVTAPTMAAKRKSSSASTSVRAFIDPYLTDSLSSPRYGPSSKKSHTRAQSESVEPSSARKRKGKEYLKTDFELDPKLLLRKLNPAKNTSSPYSDVPDVGDSSEDVTSSAIESESTASPGPSPGPSPTKVDSKSTTNGYHTDSVSEVSDEEP